MDYKNYSDMYNAFVVNNITLEEASKIFSADKSTLIAWKKKHEIKKLNTGELVIEKWNIYGDVKKVAEEIGVAVETVRYHLRKNNIKFVKDPRMNNDKIIKLHNDGKSNSEIARILGVDLANISARMKKLGLKSQHITIEKDLPACVVDEYKNGKSLQSIADEHSTSNRQVKRWLMRNGVSEDEFRSSKEQLIQYDRDKIMMMYEDGFDRFDIAESMKTHPNTIYRILREEGIDFSTDRPKELNNKDWLCKEYEKHGVPTIAKKLKCGIGMVYRALDGFGIEKRGCASERGSKYVLLNDGDELKKEYESKSMETIAKENNISNVGTVAYFLRKHGIKIRTMEERMNLMQKTINDRCGMMNDHFSKSIKSKKYYRKVGSEIILDSNKELEFADSLEADDDVVKFNRDNAVNYIDVLGIKHRYAADFRVEYEDKITHYECKPVCKIIREMKPEDKIRQDMFRQAKIGNIKFGDSFVMGSKNKSYKPSEILEIMTDDDLYYSNNYSLWFKSSEELAKFMIRVGWRGYKFSYSRMKDVFRNFMKKDIILGDDINNRKTVAIMEIIYNFHGDQLCRSRYKNYPSVFETFTQRHDIMYSATQKLYNSDRKRHIGLKSLISELNASGALMPSQFKPDTAASIYMTYCKAKGIVVDPCAGWGGRLIGSIRADVDYVGYDINELTVKANNDMIGFLGAKGVSVQNLDSRDEWPINKFDMVFTSPPYDNTEFYYGYPENYNPNTREIVDNIFCESRKKLSKNGVVVLNIPLWFKDTCIELAHKYDFYMRKKHKMKITQILVTGDKYEPILVFSKR